MPQCFESWAAILSEAAKAISARLEDALRYAQFQASVMGRRRAALIIVEDELLISMMMGDAAREL